MESYIYAALKVGFSIADLHEVTLGMVLGVIGIYTEQYNDDYDDTRYAEQADFDNF